jgi:hypothetical protein
MSKTMVFTRQQSGPRLLFSDAAELLEKPYDLGEETLAIHML